MTGVNEMVPGGRRDESSERRDNLASCLSRLQSGRVGALQERCEGRGRAVSATAVGVVAGIVNVVVDVIWEGRVVERDISGGAG